MANLVSTPCGVEETAMHTDSENESMSDNLACNDATTRRDERASAAGNIEPHRLHNSISITVNNTLSTYAQRMHCRRGGFNGVTRISRARGREIGNKAMGQVNMVGRILHVKSKFCE